MPDERAIDRQRERKRKRRPTLVPTQDAQQKRKEKKSYGCCVVSSLCGELICIDCPYQVRNIKYNHTVWSCKLSDWKASMNPLHYTFSPAPKKSKNQREDRPELRLAGKSVRHIVGVAETPARCLPPLPRPTPPKMPAKDARFGPFAWAHSLATVADIRLGSRLPPLCAAPLRCALGWAR